MALYLLFQSASGLSLFLAHGIDEIGEDIEVVRSSILDLKLFKNVVKIVGFLPFSSALSALKQCKKISKGMSTEELKNFLELNLPVVKEKKKPKFNLGVAEPKIGMQIFETTKIPCQSNELVLELLCGVRLHFHRFIKDLKEGDLEKSLLSLGHSYSRANVKLNVNEGDKMVIQAISGLDTLDKDITYSSARVRKLYSCHFPELEKIVNDDHLYAKVAKFVEKKEQLSGDKRPGLADILGDEGKADEIVEAAKASIGEDLSPANLIIVQQFTQRVLDLSKYRKKLYKYLVKKMNDIAPNMASLVGVIVGAHLISHAGGLSNLAMCRSSTIQFLGVKKVTFRASESGERTPRGGLIYHSSFIGRASAQNRHHVAHCLANKCTIACRVDCFSETKTNAFGKKLRKQVKERLDYYEKRLASRRKKIDAKNAAIDSIMNKDGERVEIDTQEASTKKRKRKLSEAVYS
ncbi:nucleolar protein 56-like protein [Cinnamomum micranthum f. kanehirae]|uniref:Nucleolar protein 56 n=1 Tax=Cinnamomum micranthum f. kanehirae TaxID=337451 RepID=A0A443N799_9MAGN|nr:nucleolar protein 56-like protein [Cinnamomum micranthum f. kanehirae]